MWGSTPYMPTTESFHGNIDFDLRLHAVRFGRIARFFLFTFQLQIAMTDKDKQLIQQAEELPCMDWDIAFDLAKEADTDEAKDRLLSIGRQLHHKEEYYAGLL